MNWKFKKLNYILGGYIKIPVIISLCHLRHHHSHHHYRQHERRYVKWSIIIIPELSAVSTPELSLSSPESSHHQHQSSSSSLSTAGSFSQSSSYSTPESLSSSSSIYHSRYYGQAPHHPNFSCFSCIYIKKFCFVLCVYMKSTILINEIQNLHTMAIKQHIKSRVWFANLLGTQLLYWCNLSNIKCVSEVTTPKFNAVTLVKRNEHRKPEIRFQNISGYKQDFESSVGV